MILLENILINTFKFLNIKDQNTLFKILFTKEIEVYTTLIDSMTFTFFPKVIIPIKKIMIKYDTDIKNRIMLFPTLEICILLIDDHDMIEPIDIKHLIFKATESYHGNEWKINYIPSICNEIIETRYQLILHDLKNTNKYKLKKLKCYGIIDNNYFEDLEDIECTYLKYPLSTRVKKAILKNETFDSDIAYNNLIYLKVHYCEHIISESIKQLNIFTYGSLKNIIYAPNLEELTFKYTPNTIQLDSLIKYFPKIKKIIMGRNCDAYTDIMIYDRKITIISTEKIINEISQKIK